MEIDKKVKLAGWIQTRRDHGKLIFIDLRNKEGILQLVFTQKSPDVYKLAETLRPEWVIEIEGLVKKRPANMVNPKITTGEIEIEVEKLEILNKSETPPFALDTDGYEINEEIRLKHRYLDLRRPRLQKNLHLRHKVIKFFRDYLDKEEFLEIETPLLTKSTPEGARDYIVPSRLKPGYFYALPQSPQQYKQLLMVAGFKKYFQIARCFRDEDTRGDRQPEFTQLDIEMSFVKQDDILNLMEKMITSLMQTFFPEKKITLPFPQITYSEAMEKYKTDKPDLGTFLWVIDFPMFEWHEGRWDAVHHPFTRPQEENLEKIKKEPDKIMAYQFDLVLNGEEIAGGSLRSYKKDLLLGIFEIMGHEKKEIEEKFGHLLQAFEFGAPPHGGIALGLDRFLTLLLNEPNIREVMAFPKTGDGRDLMMDAPSKLEPKQLKELRLKNE